MKPISNFYRKNIFLILAEASSEKRESITRESHLKDDLKLDSLEHFWLMQELETIYETRIPDEAAQSLNRAGDIIDYFNNPVKYLDEQRGRRLVAVQGKEIHVKT